ncbi:epsilon-sarcoglycan isoform X1 [Photinus pyralis]|uniref:epsilon-sarcoglycan isoform X1 n=1 Tax=Photinus pyralis TaxID=7054 RepID=UPI0012677C5F|nr:epsilon-sarcoglycan isoform X1 [Photinus pyralis]
MNKFCVLILSLFTLAIAHNITKTEVFVIHVNPTLFNWTYEENPDQFVYQPSLMHSPDLPSWINYYYSNRHHTGYLYGVPPDNLHTDVHIEIVGLNRQNYETRHHILTIHINEKPYPAKSEVHLKIDNLNVEDMFDHERVERLKNVFRRSLWRESGKDMHMTFLASAVQLGARLPPNPDEGEGVVVRIGSRVHLSNELIKLQKEVKPLWKHKTCPRDFKRTTVERFFRDAGFALDWCAFRLIEDSSSALGHHYSSTEKLEKLSNLEANNHWRAFSIDDLPERSYSHEFAVTILLPLFLFTALTMMLSFILCFHHEAIADSHSEEFLDNIFHICTDYLRSRDFANHTPTHEAIHPYASLSRTSHSLKSYSTACLSPELVSRSHTESPSLGPRGMHCRPSPPPYVRPKFKPDL